MKLLSLAVFSDLDAFTKTCLYVEINKFGEGNTSQLIALVFLPLPCLLISCVRSQSLLISVT